jgi:hypothetical protein
MEERVIFERREIWFWQASAYSEAGWQVGGSHGLWPWDILWGTLRLTALRLGVPAPPVFMHGDVIYSGVNIREVDNV